MVNSRSAHAPVRGRKRRRGRPVANPSLDVEAALLDTARALFLDYGYRAVSTRQIATRAGVDPAMVQYYFRSKRGLYLRVLQATAAPLRAVLDGMLVASDADADPFRMLELYMRLVNENAWIPALLVREVLPADGDFRHEFVSEFVRPMVERLLAVVRQAQAAGRVDPTLTPERVLISMMSLAMWPFLVRPVLGRVFPGALDRESIDALVAHTRALFERSVRTGSP